MIKKATEIVITFLIVIFQFTSCKDNEGLIRGKWQLRYIDMPDNTQISTDSVFYCFQLNIFELETLTSNTPSSDFVVERTNGIYSINKDSIFMTITPSYLEQALKSPYYGWHTSDKKFAIRKLDHSSLILSCKDTTYTFRKF